MIRINYSAPCCAAIMWLVVASVGVAAESQFAVSSNAGAVLEAHCLDCHGQDTQKGDLRLDNLAGMKLGARLDLLNRVQKQIFIKEMPPKKKKAQPSDTERHGG